MLRVVALAALFCLSLGSFSLWTACVLADDAETARAWFEQGVVHAAQKDWAAAADAFERSRALDERVPTLFNLLLAYDALERPLDVARTVRSFLTRADPGRHQAERTRALELEAKAYALLARVTLQTQPENAQVSVDGLEPVLAADGRAILLTPGHHVLEGSAEGYDSQTVSIDVAAGERRALGLTLVPLLSSPPAVPAPTLEAEVEAAPAPPAAPPLLRESPVAEFAPWRRPVARAFAIVGAATWIGSASVLGASYGRSSKLSARDSTNPGFLTATDEYQRMSRAVIPLSAVSAGVLATAVGLWPRERRPMDWVVAGVGVALLATGIGLTVSDPPGIKGTGLDQPQRELGMFIAASGAPLMAFPFGKAVR